MNMGEAEKLRRRALNYGKRVAGISVFSFFVYLFVFYIMLMGMAGADKSIFLMIGGFSAVAALCTYVALRFVLSNDEIAKFEDMFKTVQTAETAKTMEEFADVQFSLKGGLEWKELKETYTAACGMEKKYESRDRLEGLVNGMPFKAYNVKTKAMAVGSSGRRSVETIFCGPVMSFDISAGTGVNEGFMEKGGCVQIFSRAFAPEKRQFCESEKAESGDSGFDGGFDIYASGPEDVSVILSESRMKKITAFTEAYGGKTAVTFSGGKMHVALDCGEMFKPSLDQPVSSQKDRVRKDFEMIKEACGIAG